MVPIPVPVVELVVVAMPRRRPKRDMNEGCALVVWVVRAVRRVPKRILGDDGCDVYVIFMCCGGFELSLKMFWDLK